MLMLDLLKHRSGNFLPDIGKGTYILLLFLEQDKEIVVGRRRSSSSILFRAGYYAYVGRAHGPGGLRSRINRHLIKDKKSVWHIDYLRKEAVPVEVWVNVYEKKQEKIWADALVVMKGSHLVENFGNTDDRKSRTHLCYFNYRPSFRAFRRLVTQIEVTS
jgi:Uri superfamily endonuclease